MNEFNKNEQMEQISRLAEKQPDAISSEQRMSLGLYQITQQHATNTGLSAEEKLRLSGLKRRISQDILTPTERTVTALEIQNLEKKLTGENK